MLFQIIKKCYNVDNSGYALLFGVLLVGVVTSVIVVSSLVIGVDYTRTAFASLNSAQSAYLADTCAERALQRIADNNDFSGSNSHTLAGGSCQYTVIDQGGENRRIEATGSKNDHTRKVIVEIDEITPSINMVTWQEVANF